MLQEYRVWITTVSGVYGEKAKHPANGLRWTLTSVTLKSSSNQKPAVCGRSCILIICTDDNNVEIIQPLVKA
jgi:hypothetical protein